MNNKIVIGIGSIIVVAILVAGCSSESRVQTDDNEQEHSGHEHANVQETAKEPIEIADVKPYPLDICVVSGEKLGSMGAPKVLVYEGQEIKLCCNDCVDTFEKEPKKYLTKLEGGHKEHAEHSHEGAHD